VAAVIILAFVALLSEPGRGLRLKIPGAELSVDKAPASDKPGVNSHPPAHDNIATDAGLQNAMPSNHTPVVQNHEPPKHTSGGHQSAETPSDRTRSQPSAPEMATPHDTQRESHATVRTKDIDVAGRVDLGNIEGSGATNVRTGNVKAGGDFSAGNIKQKTE
jgi:hypothetical protein